MCTYHTFQRLIDVAIYIHCWFWEQRNAISLKNENWHNSNDGTISGAFANQGKSFSWKKIAHRHLCTFSGDNDLLRLFFHGKWTNQRSNFFSSFPLGELTETFLTRPYRGVNYLQEKLSSTRVEDEDSSIDRFCRQVTWEFNMELVVKL